MERLIELYPVSSSVWAVASLVIANLVPLVGVLFFGWDLWTIIALYWAENGIIGLYNVAKILKAEGTANEPLPGSAGVRLAAAQERAIGVVGRAGIAAFFLVHYGLFWFVHGIFVLFALPAFAGIGLADPGGLGTGTPGEAASLDGGRVIQARLDLVILGAVGLAISHGVAYWLDFIGRKEYLRVTPQAQAGAPYGRLVILHMTIILGAFLSAMLGVPIGALLVLVGLKTALDLALHLRERRAAATSGGRGPRPGSATSPTTGLP